MSLTKISSKGSALLCSELDANFDYVLDLANATGSLDCAKINQLSLSTCLSANNVIIGIQEDIGDNATAIGEVSQDLNDAQTTLQNNINSLITLIGNQNTTIADLTAQIGILTAAFNTLDGTVAAFNSRLLSVEGRLISLEEAIATGFIVLWSGLVSAIPTGWLFCNGTNGTPDLRDKFIVGSGGAYGINTVGGSSTHSHTLTGNTGATVLTINQLAGHNHNLTVPSHSHDLLVWWGGYNGAPYSDGNPDALNANNSALAGEDNARGGFYSPTNGNGIRLVADAPPLGGVSNIVGQNEGHSHTFSSSTAATNNLPPYYALAFIMKA